MHKIVIELTRLEENFEFGTFGIWRINKEVFCVTLEPRDEENETEISSIPAQQYELQRVKTNLAVVHKYGYDNTFEIMNVPNRTKCMVHPGCLVKNTFGCVLLAEQYGKLQGNRAILNSGKTFKKFMQIMEGIDTALLTITEHY